MEEVASTAPQELYHITRNEYEKGQGVKVNDFTGSTFYHQGLNDEYKSIDDYLSEKRSEGETSRDYCIYAFDKKEYCVYFRKRELLAGETFHLYRCKMDNPVGHPMILVGKMKSVSGEDREKLRSEYWNPMRNWKLMEYMSDRIEILEEIPITATLRTSSLMIGQCDYSEDYERAKYFLNH